MKYSLASISILAPWLLAVNANLDHPLLRFQKRDQAAPSVAETICKPPLPGLLLQQYPPSAEDEALQPLFAKVQAVAEASAAVAGVDSVAVGLVGPQGLLWAKGFGKANANGTDSTPPNEHTVYRIGSVSKMFGAMEGFLLRDKGYLNWDDPVTKHMPNFTSNSQSWKEYLDNNRQPSSNDDADPITLRQLASHTSGIGRDIPYYNVDEWPGTPSNPSARQWPTLDQQLEGIANTPLVALPGSFPVYSNTAFSVLQASLVAANAKGEGSTVSYSDLAKRDLFIPLGMNGTSFAASAENAALLALPRNPLEVFFDAGETFQAPGGQFSSVSDLAKAIQFLLNPSAFTELRNIRASTLREWIRPSYTQPDNVTETGLLWEILKLKDQYGKVQRFYGKSGDLSTFHAEVSFNRELQFGVVVLNTGGSVAPFVNRDAAQILLPGVQSILEKRVKERYAGVWKTDVNADDEIVVVVEGGILSITKWKVNGHDFLQLSQRGVLDRVSLWSTGRLDEFRIANGIASINTDALMGCFPYWATFDGMASKHVPIDLLYFEGEGDQRLMKFPAANATLHR